MALDKGEEIKQADLFASVDKSLIKRQEPIKKSDSESLTEANEKQSAPDNYVAVELCSMGKLNAPAVLHFRNYTLEEAAELTDLSQKNQYEVFAKILNHLVFEDFDCATLHKQEVLHVLLTIYATWWSPILESLTYYKDEDLPREKINKPENRGIARIHLIDDVHTIDLVGKFKSPFKVVGPDNSKYVVRMPQIGDLILAKNYCEIKYAEYEKKFYSLSKQLNRDEDVDPEELSEYRDYINERAKEGLIVERSCLLLEKDGEVLSDERRLEVARSLDLPFWNYISKIQKLNFFGINPEIKFRDDTSGDYLTRRFEFRFLDLFPSMDKEADGGYTISFD